MSVYFYIKEGFDYIIGAEPQNGINCFSRYESDKRLLNK